jgi:para-nitrobenzyl esterase
MSRNLDPLHHQNSCTESTHWTRLAIALVTVLALLLLTGCGAGSRTGASDVGTDADAVAPIATTQYGQVRGANVDGIYAFKGIPYGGSTAGENRFKPPTQPASWEGVRDALEYGNRAPQLDLTGETTSDYARMIGWDRQPGELSEDCLVLNVWTPGLADDKARPVMVSLHGGGFTSGTGNSAGYNGDPLARYGDVVVVTINHRLGAMGYLYLGDLAGPEYAHSGNAGMLDLVAALEWVRDNIESFGGNPDNVMIWGQSGGGAKTSTLLAMPGAQGLFHRAAVQSGSSLTMRTREEATDAAKALLAELGLDESQVSELMDVPFEDIIAAQAKLGGGRGFAPVVDGEVLPRHPFEPDAPEVSGDIPMIIGWTLDDAALALTNFDLDEAGLAESVEQMAGEERGAEVLAAYRAAYPDATPYLVQARVATDMRFGRGALLQAERKARQGGAPAYLYLWTWESPGMGGKFGAVHGVDVGLAFHNSAGEITGGGTEEGQLMADRLASAWVNFARTGNPNNPEIPEWPAYDADSKPTMIFDVDTRVENDPLAQLRTFWEE